MKRPFAVSLVLASLLSAVSLAGLELATRAPTVVARSPLRSGGRGVEHGAPAARPAASVEPPRPVASRRPPRKPPAREATPEAPPAAGDAGADTSGPAIDGVASLCELLRREPFRSGDWVLEAKRRADALGIMALPLLEEIAARDDCGLEERVAAAELFRLVAQASGGAPPITTAAMDGLRAAVASGASRPALAWAAAGPLGCLGSDQDRRLLVAMLAEPEFPEARRAAVRGLQLASDAVSRDPALAREIAAIVEKRGDPSMARGAVGILAAMARDDRPGAEGGRLSDDNPTVAQALQRAAADSDQPLGVRRAAVSALAEVGGEEASRELVAVLESPDTDPSLARSAGRALGRFPDTEVAGALAELSFSESVSEERQVVAAAAAAAATRRGDAPTDGAYASSLAYERLRLATREAGDVRVRRRAVFALATATDPASLRALAESALLDPDSRVRGAAIVALSRADREGAYASFIARRASSDHSPQVRALAHSSLR